MSQYQTEMVLSIIHGRYLGAAFRRVIFMLKLKGFREITVLGRVGA